jgi:hypothetical protein
MLKLPLTHTDDELRRAAQRLGVNEVHLVSFTVFRRVADARKPKSLPLPRFGRTQSGRRWSLELDEIEVAARVDIRHDLGGAFLQA